jgi:phosphoribosylformylglycinamidine synthase
VKFQALCEARGVSVLGIGVTEKESNAIDIKDIAKLELSQVNSAWQTPIT